jgi:hypothetical protein
LLFILTLIVGSVGAQATVRINTASGGYLVCVNSKTKVVTHPGTSTCPKRSKKLVLGAQGVAGANGLTGAAGIPGKDGAAGKDGKTLWNGVKDPENTWGAPGDMFINATTKTLFGPKNLDGTWPAGVSMVGPQGPQGAQGPIGLPGLNGSSGGSGPAGATGATGATGAPGASGVAAPIATGANCIGTKCTYKIGDTGPGGGLIYFVDYNDQYAGFNYLEAAPTSCESASTAWSSDTTNSLLAVNGWAARAVGSGQANTTAMLANGATSYIADASGAAFYSNALASGVPAGCVTSKDDWFLGSLGEMKLMYDNLQGLGGFAEETYWSSTAFDETTAWSMNFRDGYHGGSGKASTFKVRPVRRF